jgi:hypothetical protein
MNRKQNFQTVAWFWDLYQRQLLDLDPPYQRRSVWNQAYRDYFIDTILLDYPAPAIFLYQEIDENGKATYNVVDGKQRLTTIFTFIQNEFPTPDSAGITEYRGRYFLELSSQAKTKFWEYTFSVEYLPSDNESIVNNIFDRINRNVARLTPQELRHAKFDGEFITVAEDLTDFLREELPADFPRIKGKSANQMKDVELNAEILLLIEEGARGYNQSELDTAFSDRDLEWENKQEIIKRFRGVIFKLKEILEEDETLSKSRMRNQADFYSLFGAINEIIEMENAEIPKNKTISERLLKFIDFVEDEPKRESSKAATTYFQTSRAASNRTSARRDRIDIVKRIILGTIELGEDDDSSSTSQESL